MDLKISNQASLVAAECKWNLKCLDANGCPNGRVISHIRPKIIFVDCDIEKLCDHKIAFCKSVICQCTIRNQLYFKYKI